MGISRGVAGGMALCAAVSLALTGCGNDSADDAAATTSQSAAATTTTSAESSTTTTTSSTTTKADSSASDPLVGVAQQVSGDGWKATITVGEHPTKKESFFFNGLLVPVSIKVESGAVEAAPKYWKVVTLSGKTIPGASSTTSIPTAIGDRPLDRAAEGLIPFSSYTSTDIADDVSITEVALYPSATAKDPIARWAFPSPLSLRDIPAAKE